MHLYPLLLLIVGNLHVSGASAHAFSKYDQGLFTPVGELSSLSSTEFARLNHPAFPKHSVRVKQSHFCDGGVRAYTGYIDVEARHVFFYFFESRWGPDKDDVIYWTNGGPSGSSTIGLFMELGPCRPVDVGYSYTEYGEAVTTTKEAADDITAFITIFFEHFTRFKERAIHLAGESYGGHYIPVFASTIYDRNTELAWAGMTPINLMSIMIGNGCTDFGMMWPLYYEAQCADPMFPAIADISYVPRCKQRYKEACIDRFDAIDCNAAADFCFAAMSSYFLQRNTYDRARPCTGMTSIQDCYPIVRFTANVNIPITPFLANTDWFSFPAHFYIAALLECGVRTLIYVSASDYICNWIGNDRMTLALEWTGQSQYRDEPLRPWLLDGDIAGLTRSSGGLTFATIAGAGHLAPYDRPVQSLELANRWLAGVPL
ncbi:serine carboxypeptidase [Trametes punicea]|nr:serine carboxypeptidase [Trametes punicea]